MVVPVFLEFLQAADVVYVDVNFSIEGVSGSSFTLDQFYTKKSYYSPLKAQSWTQINTGQTSSNFAQVQISSNNVNCMNPVHFNANEVVYLCNIVLEDVYTCAKVTLFDNFSLFRVLPFAGCYAGGQCFGQANFISNQTPNMKTGCLNLNPTRIGSQVDWLHNSTNCLQAIPLPNVNIDFGINNPSWPVSTNLNGSWCNETSVGETYNVTPSKGGMHCGVDIDDISAIQNHILWIQLFTCNWQYVAADANLSNSVTASDISCLRKFILSGEGGSNCPFPYYRFDDKIHYQFASLGSIFPLQENYIHFENGFGKDDIDFYGIVIGDVNSSCADAQPLQGDPISRMSGSTTQLYYGKGFFKGSQKYVPIYAPPGRHLSLISLALDNRENRIQFVTKGDISEFEELDFANDKNSGEFRILWTATKYEFISNNLPLFYLVLDANIPDIKLSNSISTFESCIYDLQNSKTSVQLLSDVENKFDLMADQGSWIISNPVHDQLTILHKDNQIDLIHLEIIDAIGTRIITKYNFSIHEKINVNELKPGLYFLFIEDASGNTHSIKFFKS
ncbi:MAG TPA: T9SS type A sorting domain-containing protein [Saprospiraceae bacterium]|nr:T9SS type A sorting domain-containing protein [Saprospiraceae bacterium]